MTWQPIETAPRIDDGQILGWSAEHGVVIYEWYEVGMRWDVAHDPEGWATQDWRPTHWMPLPAPPGEGE